MDAECIYTKTTHKSELIKTKNVNYDKKRNLNFYFM